MSAAGAKSRRVEAVEVVDGGPIRLVPIPRIDLATIEQCRVEAARVYRQMRAGRIDPSDGSKLVYCVTQIAKLVEIGTLEERLRALEAVETPRRLP
jgi:hypothetical protein